MKRSENRYASGGTVVLAVGFWFFSCSPFLCSWYFGLVCEVIIGIASTADLTFGISARMRVRWDRGGFATSDVI